MRKLLFLVFLSFFLFYSCGDNNKVYEDKKLLDSSVDKIEKVEETNKVLEVEDWSKLIYYHSSKDISALSKIEVSFIKNLKKDADLTDLIEFSPKVEGSTKIEGGFRVVFIPKKPLKQGQVYEANLNVSKLLDNLPKGFQNFKFKFNIIKQKAIVEISGFENNSQKNDHLIKANISFVDTIKQDIVEKSLSAVQGKEKLNIKLIKNTDKSYGIIISGVKKYEKESEVAIKFLGKEFALEDQEEKIKIPALAKFEVLKVTAVNADTRFINIVFSQSLLTKQNLKGLITVKRDRSHKRIRLEAKNNKVKVYFYDDVVGKVTVKINSGIKSLNKKSLKDSFSKDLVFENLKPAVKFVGKGVILPNSKQITIPFEAVNLKAVRVKAFRVYQQNIGHFLQANNYDGSTNLQFVGRFIWEKRIELTTSPELLSTKNRYALDVSELTRKYPNELFRLTISGVRKDSAYKCVGTFPAFPKDKKIKNIESYKVQESSYWDNYQNNNNYVPYSKRKNPCYDYYYRSVTSSRNIMASDIGIIVKQGEGSILHIVTTSIQTARPLSNAKITAYNFQGGEIASTKSDNNGFANLDLKENKAFYVLAKKNNQKGYLKLTTDAILSINNFDTSGVKINNDIKGHIYGERAVWRPGDDMYLTFVLKDNGKIPKNHPITMDLYNPNNSKIKTYKPIKSLNKFHAFKLRTSDNAITGNWKVVVNIGQMKFTKFVKVETVVPNRLKVIVETESKTVKGEGEKFDLASEWLHGAKASNLAVKVDVILTPIKTMFKTYRDYTFDDFTRTNNLSKKNILDTKLDKDGKTSFKFNMEDTNIAPSGMMKAIFETKVFEDGGGFSVDTFSLPFSYYNNYIGIKMPKGGAKRGILLTDKEQTIKIASLNEKGEKSSVDNINVEIYKISWRWWWSKTPESLARYSQSSSLKSIISGKALTKDGEGSFKFEIKYPQWGRYLVRACDAKEFGHCTSKIFYVDWPGWAGRARKDSGSGATRLNFTTDKKKYNVGEKATVFLPAASNGRALISVERGSKVLFQQWASVKKGENKIAIPITKEMSPNIYFNVSLLQAHEFKKNDAPIRLYGIVPILVEDPSTNLKVNLKVADEVKPLTDLEVKVSENSKKAMTYTIAVVDEGLLSLTRFKTPNLKKEFYKKEGLLVKTWDLFDYVIGAYGINLEKIISIGGDDDEDADNRARSKKKRFIPVVKYIGPFYLKAGTTNTHKIRIPKYVGAVRVMVVAGSKKAYGFAKKEVKVKSNLMVLGSLPRTLKPNDELLLPITAFSINPLIKDAEITLTTDSKINIIADKAVKLTKKDKKTKKDILIGFKETKSVSFDGIGEKMAFFKIKVNSVVGKSLIKVEAKTKKFKASYNLYIDVKAPNNISTIVKNITIDANKDFNTKILAFGIKNSNNLSLEISTIPPLNLEKRLSYLIKYPHGCIEQTTSSVFPQLYLKNLVKLDDKAKTKIEDNIKAAIERIQKFQNSEGGFTYWPQTGDKANLWGTNYAFNFLIEAEKKGYLIPEDLRSKAVNFQHNKATTWTDNKNRLIQSYRLYTLAIANKPNIGAMNRLKELKDLTNTEKWILASSYYLVGQQDIALKMVKDFSTSVKEYNELSNTYGSTLRDEAIILNSMSILKYKKANDLLKKIATKVSSSNYYSTQTTAYSLMSLSKFYSSNKTENFNFKLTVGKKETKFSSDSLIFQRKINKFSKGVNIKLENSNSHPLFLSIINKGIPASGEEKEYSNDISISTKYNYVKIEKLKQSTDFTAVITVKNLKNKKLENLALTYILPSGVQINRNQTSNYYLDYKDLRDDRAHYYFSLKPNETKTIKLNLNASYKGKYYLPSVSVSAMYDDKIGALLKGQWIEIE